MLAHAALLPPNSSEEKELEIVSLLREMFNQIDVDGDGTMDWEELTAFIVQSGLMATANGEGMAMKMRPSRCRYDEERIGLLTTKHGKL